MLGASQGSGMDRGRTPVLVGVGQAVDRGPPETALGPLAMLHRVSQLAGEDAGIPVDTLATLDTLAVVGFTVDAPTRARRFPLPRIANPPGALAAALGAKPATSIYTHMGGNTPQALVAWASDRIAAGQSDVCLLAGCEYLGSLRKRAKAGLDLSMYGDFGAETTAERWGDPRPGSSAYEERHGLDRPIAFYPLFENALRAKLGRGLEEHARALGALFGPFSARAAANPYAWFPTARSAEEIAFPGPSNRMVAFPYPKYLNAVIEVDQAAALLLMSAAAADRLGVPQDRRIYPLGAAEANEVWYASERAEFTSAPAIALAGAAALEMAGCSLEEIGPLDIYSCFPSAVQIACAALGVPLDRRGGLTLTGGLPYFGGPGNNYSMHAIAELAMRLRSEGGRGLITANGWYLTKHAIGVYGAEPPARPWRRDPEAVAARQAAIDAERGPELVEAPKEGLATVETYTVLHDRDGPERGIIVGRDAQGRRFIANLPPDPATLAVFEAKEGAGRRGRVRAGADGVNLFEPE